MKKIFVISSLVLLVAAVLLVPLPSGTLNDGGTKVYTALTYKLVVWNVVDEDGVYHETKLYVGTDRGKSIDELWAIESENVLHTVRARVVEISGDLVTVEPLEGEWERSAADRISINVRELDKIAFEVGTVVAVTYKGAIMESYPAQINAVSWELGE